MADFNQLTVDPKLFFIKGTFAVDPSTVLTPPKQFDTQSVKTLTVANGATLLVYDVTNPAAPVLIGTIG